MYQFAGFFARPVISRPPDLPAGAVWRDISVPFEGSGLLLPDLVGESPPLADVDGLAKRLGLHSADTWLYLAYDCWGGHIDFVYGLSMRGGVLYGPVEESDWDAVEATYIGLMVQWGVAAEDALSFAPFTRGFWGEV
jgi:hypothetical protein